MGARSTIKNNSKEFHIDSWFYQWFVNSSINQLAEVPKWLKGLPWKGSRSLVAARGFKSLLLRSTSFVWTYWWLINISRVTCTLHFESFAFSVACRHAIKSNIQICLRKRASDTDSNIRFCNVPWKPHIENKLNLKYLRYKTSEAYRKIRKPKESSKVNTRPGEQRYAP